MTPSLPTGLPGRMLEPGWRAPLVSGLQGTARWRHGTGRHAGGEPGARL